MTSQGRRQAVADQYAILIGRNYYSQALRDYCYKAYKDGKYYSDCSSSICYAYKQAGEGFGILNTAGIYNSDKLETASVSIASGVPQVDALRVGDMLEFAGEDKSRPKRIGHVEMVYSIAGGKAVICGHGSGRPSYKDMAAYCRGRYNAYAAGGWRKGLVCVRRAIRDDGSEQPTTILPDKLSGWVQGSDGWRFYLGNTGEAVRNAWYQDRNGKWYWFRGDGLMVHDVWYRYKDHWYYLGSDGAMLTGQQTIGGKWYVLGADGAMLTDPVTLTPDQDGALRYDGLAG